jgi:ADP-heptose:LPS heptosyltransferase
MPWIEEVKCENPKDIYIISNVGLSYGDYLILTPLFRGFREIYPDTEIIFTPEIDEELNILYNNPDISSILDFNKFLDMYKNGNNIFGASFDGVYQLPSIVRDEVFTKENAYQAYCDDAGITPSSYIPEYYIREEERQQALELLSQKNIDENEYIVIQTEASSPIRNWHPDYVMDLAYKLAEDYKIVLLGAYPKWFDEDEIQHDNILYCIRKTSVRNACAIVGMSKLTICPDSLFAHVSGALYKKCLVLMSSFLGDLRYNLMPTIEVLQKEYHCAPCLLHNIDCCEYGKNSDTDDEGNYYSMPCMMSITPDEVYKNIMTMI